MTTGSRTSGQDSPPQTAASSQSLVALEADAVKLRAEVAQLQAELATLRGGTLLRNESDVLEANEQLVLAAVRAQAVAENAAALRLVRQTTARARSHDLQQANSQLVASSLHAQEQEAHAHQGHAQALSAMATAAHELRNPLSPIRMAAELLGEARGDLTRFTRLRGIIETEVMHLARLVEDLLDGSRLASGKLRLERTDTGLARVLEIAVETCRPVIDSRRQQIVIELPPGDAMRVHGDHTRLVQVFSNLLDNASKYTPEGGRIDLVATRLPDALAVRIRDTGIGIPAEALLHVFDLFFQDTAAAVLRPGGLGIGLAIVRELVEAHGGTVDASSGGEGQGSTFEVTLPAQA